MKVAIIYNKDLSKVINRFGMQNKETYNEKTVQRVAKSLESRGHNVAIIDGNMDVFESLQNFMPKVIEEEKMGMVFNMAYGIQGESRYTHIPSMLEMLGIPYVGSNPSGHAIALDKVITKVLMQKENISTPDFWAFNNSEEDMSTVKYPVIVKPKMEAVSFGLKVVYNAADLKEAVEFITTEFSQQALVEQFIPGREFAVGILGNSPVEAFPVLEIDLNNDPNAIQSVEDKKQHPRQKICPADLPAELAEAMQQESIRAFNALQLKDFSRVDIRLDENGKFYILEINSMASLGASGSYPFSAQAAGYSYEDLVNKILDVASNRYFGDKYLMYDDDTHPAKQTFAIRTKSYLRNRQQKYEKILQSMVDMNTHVRNTEGVNRFSTYLKKHLSGLGFSHQIYPQSEVGDIYLHTNGDDKKMDILFISHLDNSIEAVRHKYFSESEQKFYGTGVWSNKGGLTVLLAALDSLKARKVLKNKNIGILLTTDSALRNRVSASLVQRISEDAKYVIGLAGADRNGGIITSRSGAVNYDVLMNLKRDDEVASVPIIANRYIKLVTQWMKMADNDDEIIIAPSRLNFESNLIQTFAHGKASFSLRYNKNDQIAALEQKIEAIVPKKLKDIDVHLRKGPKRPAMEHNENTDHLWQMFKSESIKTDIGLRQEHRWSSSEICLVNDRKHRIDGLGPVGDATDNQNEFILLHSILEKALLLAIVIEKLE